MAPLPVVPSTLRVACKHTWDLDTDVLSRFFITYTGSAPTAGQLDTFCTAVASAWASDLAPLCPSDIVLTEVEAIDLTSATSAQGLATVSDAGSRSGVTLSADTCLLVGYEINRRYRGGHPRGYWPFGVQADLFNAQTWASAFVSACATDFASFFAAVIAAGWSGAGTLSHTNASIFEGFTVEISPSTGRARNVPTKRASAVVDAVTSLAVRSRVASQRRRLGKS